MTSVTRLPFFFGDMEPERQPPTPQAKTAALLNLAATDRRTGDLDAAREAVNRAREVQKTGKTK